MASTERDNAGLEADIGISLGKLTRQLASAEARMVKTAKKFETDFANANRKVSAGFDRTTKSAMGSADVMGREMDRLRAKYDPIFAASKRYEASLEELNRAHKVGALNTQTYERALESLNVEYARASGVSRSLTGGLAGVASGAGQMRTQIQNAAFQVGDFAVQVGAGTSASMALGQQLPQLLGGFGVMGAVLGAVVAAGVPLVRFLLDTGDAGKDLEEKLKTLEEAVQSYSSAVEMAQIPTEELRKKYAGATEAAQTFIAALLEINKSAATDALSASIAQITEQFGGLGDEMFSRGAVVSMSEIEIAAEKIAEQFGVTQEAALAFAEGLRQLQDAEGPVQAASAADDLLQLMIQTMGPIENMNAGARQLAEQLATVGLSAGEVQGNIEKTNFGIQDMIRAFATASDNLAIMISQSGALGDNMYRAASAAWSFLQARAREKVAYESTVGRGRGADPRLFGGSTDDIIRNVPAAQLAAQDAATAEAQRKAAEKAAKAAKAKGGRKGRTETPLFEIGEKALQNLERQIELIGKTKSEMAALGIKYRLLDEAKKRNLDLDQRQAETGQTLREQIDAQAEAIGRLTEKYEAAEERAKFFDDMSTKVKDGLVEAIIEGESFAGVLADVAKALAKAALQAALFNEGPFASSGGGGGLLGGLFDAVLGAFSGSSAPKTSARPVARSVPSLDGGGFTGRGGRSGGVDGKGGFHAILHPNETVIDHTKGSLGGGGAVINYAPVIDARGADAEAVQRLEIAMQRSEAEFSKKAVAAVKSAQSRTAGRF